MRKNGVLPSVLSSFANEGIGSTKITLDDDLVLTVDRVARKKRMTRSAFTRDAPRMALKHLKITELEEKHRSGYAVKPVSKGEFDVWEKEQNWEASVRFALGIN